jgi:hypothetical protein
VRCYYCLSTEGKISTYSNDEAGLVEGDYHPDCALAVGYNEWDKEDG